MDYKYFKKIGRKLPCLGMGTWGIGGKFRERDSTLDELWISGLKKGLELGLTLIDTAEVYGEGRSEELVGTAIQGYPREDLFIVSKVWPNNAGQEKIFKSAEASCKRLGTYIDLYLLHWPSDNIPLKETMVCMEQLVSKGLIRYIGVSNFELNQLEEANNYLSRNELVSVQNQFSLKYRKYEGDVIPFTEREGMMFMAYTPIEKGALSKDQFLIKIGQKYGKTGIQVALNWLLYFKSVVAIPKATKEEHIEENLGSVGWRLNKKDWEAIGVRF